MPPATTYFKFIGYFKHKIIHIGSYEKKINKINDNFILLEECKICISIRSLLRLSVIYFNIITCTGTVLTRDNENSIINLKGFFYLETIS